METNKEKQLAFETFRAAIDIINEDERSFTCVAASDRAIKLQGWKYSDDYETFTEKLSFDAGAMMTERLEIGLPLFPSHWDRDATDQLGISTDYRSENGQLITTIKLGARADEALWSDIKNKITRTVSLGFNIHSVRKEMTDGMSEYTVTKWEPRHIALAPEPADVNCTVRSSATIEGEKVPAIKIEKDVLKNLLTK